MNTHRILITLALGASIIACGDDDSEQSASKVAKAKVDHLKRTVTCKFTDRTFDFRCESAENCIPKNFSMVCGEDFMPLIPQGARSVNNWIKDGHWNERKNKWAHFQLKVKELSGKTIIASKNADIHLKTSSSHNAKAKQIVYGYGIMHYYDEGFMTDTLKLKNVTLVSAPEYQSAIAYRALSDAIVKYKNKTGDYGSDSSMRYAIEAGKRNIGEQSPLYKAAFYLNKTNPDDLRRATATDNFNRDKFLLHALNFDLETVIGLLKKGDLKDYSELEAKINDPASGINNVDVDGDKKVDWVAIEESIKDKKIHLSFVAYPSSAPKNKSLHVVVAQLSLDKKPNAKPDAPSNEKEEIHVEGGYPDYVDGYDDYYYRHRYYVLTEAQLARYMWQAERKAYERSWKQYQKLHKAQAARHLREMRAARSSYRMKMGMAAIGAALLAAKLAQRSRAKSFKMVSPRAKPAVVAKTRQAHTKVRQVRVKREAARVKKAERKAAARRARSVRSRGRSSRSRGSRRGK